MPAALSQRDSMPDESPPRSAGPARRLRPHMPDRGASRPARPGQESGRTARYRPAPSLPAAGVPGLARRSLLSASRDPATVTRTLAIAGPDGAGKPGPAVT